MTTNLTSESPQEQQLNAVRGRWSPIRGDGTPAGISSSTPVAGQTFTPGTYQFRLPCGGNDSVTVTLNPSLVSGACTARVFTPQFLDAPIGFATQDASVAATSIALAQGTQSETTVATLGEYIKILELVVPGGGQLSFSVAEFRALVGGASGGGGGFGGSLTASNARIGLASKPGSTPSATFTRHTDTTPYTIGDIVAPQPMAPLSWSVVRNAGETATLRRVTMSTSNPLVANKKFRLYLYAADPTAGIVNGDNGAFSTAGAACIGKIDLDFTSTKAEVFTDESQIIASFLFGSDIKATPAAGTTIYGLLKDLLGYTPLSAEVITIVLDVEN